VVGGLFAHVHILVDPESDVKLPFNLSLSHTREEHRGIARVVPKKVLDIPSPVV
jgi:hypothetical protein